MPDQPDIINELADWIAAPARANLQRTTAPFQLFAHAAEEVRNAQSQPVNFTDPYAVLRGYGGDAIASTPRRDASLQLYAVGTKAASVMALAEAIFQSLLAKRQPDDDVPTPARWFSLQSFFVEGIFNLRPPGLLGRDAQNRIEVVFNFDLVYRSTPSA